MEWIIISLFILIGMLFAYILSIKNYCQTMVKALIENNKLQDKIMFELHDSIKELTFEVLDNVVKNEKHNNLIKKNYEQEIKKLTEKLEKNNGNS